MAGEQDCCNRPIRRGKRFGTRSHLIGRHQKSQEEELPTRKIGRAGLEQAVPQTVDGGLVGPVSRYILQGAHRWRPSRDYTAAHGQFPPLRRIRFFWRACSHLSRRSPIAGLIRHRTGLARPKREQSYSGVCRDRLSDLDITRYSARFLWQKSRMRQFQRSEWTKRRKFGRIITGFRAYANEQTHPRTWHSVPALRSPALTRVWDGPHDR